MNQIIPPARLVPADPTRFPSDLVAAARVVADGARARAPRLDADDAFPSDDIKSLGVHGLLTAPLPRTAGGLGMGHDDESMAEFARVLMIIGGGNLPLGRLYEGHVNALRLIAAHGRPEQLAHFAKITRDGALFAVWNTAAKDDVRLTGRGPGRRLEGRKVFASGAGHVAHPLITARDDDGKIRMVVPTVTEQARADLSGWTAHGMRASGSGAVDFTGIVVDDHQIIGGDDAFHTQPAFSTGAWRFAAVQTGGIGAVFDAARTHLVATGRRGNPHQQARMGAAALAIQSARQWVLEAATMADDASIDPAARIAHVNLARCAVERAGLDVLQLAQRSVGLAGFQRTHPLERLSRDLATYLRQPDPDGALCEGSEFVLASPVPVLDTWPWP